MIGGKVMNVLGAAAAVITVAAWWYGWIWPLMYAGIAVLGACYTAQWRLIHGDFYRPSVPQQQITVASVLLQKMMEKERVRPQVSRKTLISRSLDNALQEVAEMWQLVDNISSRLSEIDVVTVLTKDVVDTLYEHFKSIRLAQKREGEQTELACCFQLHPWLRDEESEQECLCQICEALLLILLPPPYAHCDSYRHLLREIIATSVFKVTVDMLCDPDYINEKILAYILQQEKLMADTKRTYTYAASYEDFVKMINASDRVDELKQMRYKIISEIMQATTINNLKKAQGINTDKESSPKSTAKGELLKARNLKRYINQLTVAKQLVEKRMQVLGGSGGAQHSTDAAEGDLTYPGQKILSFSVIMEKPKAREYFMRFLEKDGSDFLLTFWTDVEMLRSTSKVQQHQVGNEVYQQYVASPTHSLPIDKSTVKGMELFLRGDGGPEAFYEGQRQVREVLEKQHYHLFIVSDLYHQYVSTQEEEEELDNSDEGEEEEEMLADQSYHARQLLRQLDTKITNKVQAIQALLSSQKLEKDKDMEQEVEKMRVERSQLEAHIERTKTWTENVGHWRVFVVNASIEIEEDRKVPQFVLLVSVDGGDAAGQSADSKQEGLAASPHTALAQDTTDSARGWAVSRSLDDFYALHDKLAMIGQWLQKKDLPSQGAGLFRSMDAAYLEKAKSALHEYMAAVMQDERMIYSETLYAFLAPSPQFLHQPITQRRQKFSVSLLKRTTKDDRTHDSVAKPLYRLLGEVFELRGMFKWLRRSFMTFVELTFGSNINRQLREIVKWTYSEQMLLFYIRTFKESMWPGGVLAQSPAPKTEAQKFETRMAAKHKLLQNIPDTLKNLVGEDNARHGTIKVFEVLQDKTLNKHLLYNLLEIFLLELCPELKKTHDSLVESLQRQSASQATS
ncbi:hypothetical protein BaRGS_00012149 [Batillaria attramentaria]|uniref:Sorting nexin-25 n=1 Tax=Batillaria attramentaria TaxID=370345 RepID=A0ABD0LC05_9CAEN